MKTLILIQTHYSKKDEIQLRENFKNFENIIIMSLSYFIRSRIKILEKYDKLIIISNIKNNKIKIIKKIQI